MKHLQSWLKFLESADSPELVGKFSPEEIKKLARTNSPYKSDYRKFQHGLYSGPASGNLNMSMSDAQRKRFGGTYGITEALYQKIIKEIPQFKNFECNNGYEYEKDYELHFKKEKEIESKKGYTTSVELWVKYRAKLESGDSYIGYKQGKIYFLFVTSINRIRKDNNLFNVMKDPENPADPGAERDSPLKQLFTNTNNQFSSSYIEPTPEQQKKEDELWDKIIGNIMANQRGSIDDEDLSYYKKLQVNGTNYTVDSFYKKLPTIKKNLEIFEKYVKNKFNHTI